MCKPQCVPAEKDGYVSMFPLSEKLYPSVLKHVYERTCAHLHTHWSFFFRHLSTNLRSSHLLLTPSMSLSATQSLFHVTQRSRRMKPLLFFFFSPCKRNFYFSLTINTQPSCEVKTDVVVCCRHAKQLNPTQRVGVMSHKFLGPCTFFWPSPDTNTHLQLSSLTECSLPVNTLFHFTNVATYSKNLALRRYQ